MELLDIELGQRYRDMPTGFTGVATGKAEFITGQVLVLLEAAVARKQHAPDIGDSAADGALHAHWLDVKRCRPATS